MSNETFMVFVNYALSAAWLVQQQVTGHLWVVCFRPV